MDHQIHSLCLFSRFHSQAAGESGCELERDPAANHREGNADNDPDDKTVDPSNRDSNKGIVSNRYAPFTELLDSMKSINGRIYGIADYYDRGNP